MYTSLFLLFITLGHAYWMDGCWLYYCIWQIEKTYILELQIKFGFLLYVLKCHMANPQDNEGMCYNDHQHQHQHHHYHHNNPPPPQWNRSAAPYNRLPVSKLVDWSGTSIIHAPSSNHFFTALYKMNPDEDSSKSSKKVCHNPASNLISMLNYD